MRSLTFNDEQFHALEKIKAAGTGKKIKELLNDDVKVVVAQIAECLADWYKRAQTINLKTQILEKDIGAWKQSLYTVREHLFQLTDDLAAKDAVDAKKSSDATKAPSNKYPLSRDAQIYLRVSGGRNTNWGGNSESFFLFQNALLCQHETKELLRQNARLIELVQKLGMGQDDDSNSNSIDDSRL